MNRRVFQRLYSGQHMAVADVPVLPMDVFRDSVLRSIAKNARIAAFFGVPAGGNGLRLYGVLANDSSGALSVGAAEVEKSYPSLTPECPQADWFEREIAEQWGARPEGHPWLKPIRFHRSRRPGHDAWGRGGNDAIAPGAADYYRVEGEEVHEVAVGPVHAGIIEPGHFRFQCHGENVLHLEISLGYQHRGVERALVGGPTLRTPHYMETLAGDTSVGHALAYAQIAEGLSGTHPPSRAHTLRAVALELERLANHTGDLGALAGDVGYLPTASYCGRIRGDFLNMTALLCGNRYSRGLIRPGGVMHDLDEADAGELLNRLEAAQRDVTEAVELLWNSPSVMARFEGAGRLDETQCRELGLVGPVARACGIERDVRVNFPAGLYGFVHLPVSTWPTGDVFARALVRWLEIRRSIEFIQGQLRNVPAGALRSENAPFKPERFAVSLVEGWRGEIVHAAITDEAGRIAAYKVVDPSFHNWFGLAMAMRGQPISDFPLCNKSFNLSYCGHDL